MDNAVTVERRKEPFGPPGTFVSPSSSTSRRVDPGTDVGSDHFVVTEHVLEDTETGSKRVKLAAGTVITADQANELGLIQSSASKSRIKGGRSA